MDSDRTALSQDAKYRRSVLRVGGGCAVVGGVGFIAAGAMHGNLPGETEAALRYLAPRADWTAVHLAAIVSALLWVPAFAALANPLREVAGRILGRLAVASLMIGVAIFIIDYSIDGYAMKFLADDWAAATTDEDRQAKLLAADAVLGVARGTVRSSLTWLFGLPFLLVGLAIAMDRGLRRWLGWIAVGTGGGTFLAGMAAYVRARPEDPVFLVGILLSFSSFVWLTVMGLLLWRRATNSD